MVVVVTMGTRERSLATRRACTAIQYKQHLAAPEKHKELSEEDKQLVEWAKEIKSGHKSFAE